ncbi:PilZ domain-containing protein, partial [Candidatus Omnitrophota bacterium]
SGKEQTQECTTLNVSFNGAYVTDISNKSIKPEDNIKVLLSVPRDEARDFPFSRLVGKAKVVRVEDDGLALEFDKDMSRLFVAN